MKNCGFPLRSYPPYFTGSPSEMIYLNVYSMTQSVIEGIPKQSLGTVLYL
ncbi:MAG: hypothetical protein KAI83_17760 [Thiomargarita sp.]|nr:hypothetical protein [Thiomargarita sp.]